MPQKPRTPPKVLAPVSKLKPPRRAYKSLSEAVADDDVTERDVLVLVRKRRAKALDGQLTAASLGWMMRQFTEMDQRIRALNAVVVPDVVAADGDRDDGDQRDAFDPSKI